MPRVFSPHQAAGGNQAVRLLAPFVVDVDAAVRETFLAMLHAAACTLMEKELDGIGTMRKQLASREVGIKPTGESEEAMLVRFLRARRGSVAKAVDMLQADLAWRRAHRGRRLRARGVAG